MDKKYEYNSPLVYQRADPFVYLHTDGYYYFTGTMPQYDCIEIRRAKTLNGLLTADSEVVWKKHPTGEMGSHIWAPELHYIDGVWYIYFTAGDAKDVWEIRPYLLMCEDENPMTGKWIEKGRIDVGVESFSLDMTTFIHKGEQYVLWAQKTEPADVSDVYIAKMKNPWTLATKPMIITTPEYDWEVQGFKVNEGPAVLVRNGKVIVTYSASDTGWRYCMGMLWADENSDLLDIKSWHKSDKPVFKTSEENKQYGPGHNCFTTDNGKDVLIYHSRNYKKIKGDPLHDNNRHARAKVFEYDENGHLAFTHNPFSMPQGGMDALQNQDPTEILAYQYDIVCNGVELSSGAVRNHDLDIMVKAFDMAGYSEDDLKSKFSSLYNAFQYGAPPHAGMAPGVDRMIMLLTEEENIREVIAFPMNSNAQDLLLGSPGEVTEQQLREVHIKLR